MAVDVEPGEALRFSAPRVVLPELGLRYRTSTAPLLNWDVSPLGESFVFIEPVREGDPELEVVVTWTSELEGRALQPK